MPRLCEDEEGAARPSFLLAEQRRGWSLMIFCARATRGREGPRWTRAVEDQSAPIPQR